MTVELCIFAAQRKERKNRSATDRKGRAEPKLYMPYGSKIPGSLPANEGTIVTSQRLGTEKTAEGTPVDVVLHQHAPFLACCCYLGSLKANAAVQNAEIQPSASTPSSPKHTSPARAVILGVFSLCYLLPLLAHTSTPLEDETVLLLYLYTFYTSLARVTILKWPEMTWSGVQELETGLDYFYCLWKL